MEKVTINGVIHEFTGELGDCLATIINEELNKKETNIYAITLEGGVIYNIYTPITSLMDAQSEVIIIGNHATIIDNFLPYNVPSSSLTIDEIYDYQNNSYAIDFPLNPDLGLTEQADKRVVIKNLNIKGNCSAIRIQGSYATIIEDVTIYDMKNGIDIEFGLQTIINKCRIHYRSTAIKLGIIGNDYNRTQSNVSEVTNTRIYALAATGNLQKDCENGLVIESSNLVKVEGFITEGSTVESGIKVLNEASTVQNIEFKRCHFENSLYNVAALHFDAMWLGDVVIDQMYYSGVNGLAIKSDLRQGYTSVTLRNMGWIGKWKIDQKTKPNSNMAVTTWWRVDSINNQVADLQKWNKIFYSAKPYYFYINSSRKYIL